MNWIARWTTTAGPATAGWLAGVLAVGWLAGPGGADTHHRPQPVQRAAAAADTPDFEEQVTGVGNVGLAFTNFGVFGNNFNVRTPSFEYPLGAGVEHLVRAGVWVGAIRADTGDTLVSTGTADGFVGDDTDAATEFRPTSAIVRRSLILTDRNYSPAAISEEDYVTAYADTTPVDRTNAEDHVPMGIEVTKRMLGWSYEPADGFILVELEVTNINADVDLLDLYIGVYAELASGFKGRYEDWPPGGAWFDQKELEFDPERILLLEHHTHFDGGAAPQYGCIAVLGSRPIPVDLMRPAFRWWPWEPGSQDRDTDVERYGEMAAGGYESLEMLTLMDDPAELLAVGPWPLLGPGESATLVLAFIGGNNVQDAQAKADWAREAFRRDYIVPLPPPSPRLVVEPRPGGVTVRWDASPEAIEDPATGLIDFAGYRVFLSRGDTDAEGIIWFPVAEVDLVDGLGFDTGLDHVRESYTDPETRRQYDYRFDVDSLKDGHKYLVSVVSYDTGDPETPSLQSGLSQNRTAFVPGAEPDPAGASEVMVFPNPYRGTADWDGATARERVMWFANLPPRGELRIFTVSGDLVDTVEFDAATYHAAGTAGVYDPGRGEDRPELSGGAVAWDLLSWNNQPIASGLYLFSVRNLDTGDHQTGRFMVLK